MDKKVLIIIVGIVLSIGAGTTYLLNSSADNVAVKKTAEQSQQSNPENMPSNSMTKDATSNNGVYKDYSPTAIAETNGTKLLFFHASWCPQCRALEADIKQKGVPGGVVIIKVDYDTNQALRQKYGVTLQTTIVRVDDNGNLVKKYVSYDEPTLEAVKRNLL